MSLEPNNSAAGVRVTYNELSRSELEPIPAKSPHRKYLILLALHLLHTDDPLMLSEAADCSERTFHYVKKRLSQEDGVILNYDRSARRYELIQSGVLDLPRVAELMRRHYPLRYAHIERLSQQTRAAAAAS
jgi:hypothetical protein